MQKKKFIFMKWLALPLLAFTLFSCYPEYDKEVEDYDVVITMKNSTTFTSDEGQSVLGTYFLADTIIHIADSLENDLDPDFPRDFDQDILNTVVENFDALGYERITDTTNMSNKPDVLISISALASRTTVLYSYYPGYWWGGGYWGGYWWGAPGYWYPYYPYYPPYYTGYSYNKGSVFIDMVSFDESRTEGEQIVSEWTGVLNGLLYEANTPTQERIIENIDIAFERSPYLNNIDSLDNLQ